MTTLNFVAFETLRVAGLSPEMWAQRHGHQSGEWRGDECGCPDDRCIGFHHDASEECGCLPALIEELRRDERKLVDARKVWAAHLAAAESGDASDRVIVDELVTGWITTYSPGAIWYSLTASPRGIVYRNRWNDRTWLIYDAEHDTIEVAEVAVDQEHP